MSIVGDGLDWLIKRIPALDKALNGTPDEPLDAPLGQLDVEKAAQELEDRRRERQNGVHR